MRYNIEVENEHIDVKPPPPENPPGDLPDSVSGCHDLINELRATVKALQEQVAELKKQVSRRNRKIFGKQSAKVSNTVLTGTGKEIYDTDQEELESEKAKLQIVEPEKTHGGGGRTAPEAAPIEDTVNHEITDPNELACVCCGIARKVIGFRVSHQLDILQAVFKSIKHVQYSYSCPKCNGEVVTAPKPEQPFGKGYATGALVAHIANAKFNWHQPLYRQEQIYRAQSVPLGRSSMCRLLKDGAAVLELIVRRMHQLVLQSRYIQSDTTSMPVIKKGLGKTHKGSIWIVRGDEAHPYLVFEFTERCNGAEAERIMKGFKKHLMTDGASVFNGVIEGGATAINCWAHAYRYFEDAKDSDEKLAMEAIAMIKGLFAVERVGKEMPETERLHLRRRISKKRLSRLKEWLDEQVRAESFLPKSKLGEAVNYCLNRWPALNRYADTGFLPIDNNWSENGLRPAVLGRRNWLFSGSVEGGKTGAIYMSIVQTCKRLKIDPFEYMQDVLTRFPFARTSEVDDFLPDRWKALRAAK